MYTSDGIYIGLADGERINMSLNICNRHGLIAGASRIPLRCQGRCFRSGLPRRAERGHGKTHRQVRDP